MSHIPPSKHKPQEAEKQFDIAVYGGIGTVVTTLLSVAGGDWVLNGPGKQKAIQLAERFGSSLSRASGAARDKCVTTAHSWIITAGLMAGGLVTLLPIKYAEDHKPEWVRALHERKLAKRRACGEAISETEIITAEAALEELQKKPRQTWGSILAGRVVGTAAVFGTMGLVGGQAKKVSGDIARAAAQHVSETQAPAAYRIVDASVLDAFCTAICTGTLYVYSHFLCPPKHKTAEASASQMPPEPAVIEPVSADNNATEPRETRAHRERLAPKADFRQRATEPPPPTQLAL